MEKVRPNDLKAFLSLFEDEFSIDWIVDLTDKRPSDVITEFEKGFQEGWLKRSGQGFYILSDNKIRSQFSDYFNQEEKNILHQKITEYLIQEFSDVEQAFHFLTPHLLSTKNDIIKSDLLVKIGDLYRKNYRNEKAHLCYSKVLDDLSDVLSPEADQIFIDASIKYSKVSVGVHETNTLIQVLQNALERAKRNKNLVSQSLLEMHIAKCEWLSSKYGRALKHFEAAWSIANRYPNSKLLHSANVFVTFFLYWQGRFREAVQNYEKAVPDIQKYPTSGFPLLAALTVGHCYVQVGDVTQGLGMIDFIRQHCLNRGDKYLASHAGVMIGATMLEVRDLRNAIENLEISLEEARREQNNWAMILGMLMLSFSYYLAENNKKSVKYLNEVLTYSKKVGVTVRPYPYLLELGWAMENGILPKVSNFNFDAELSRHLANNNIFMKGIAYRYKALLSIKEGEDFRTILRYFKDSIKWLKLSGHRIAEARTQLELSRYHLSNDDVDKAKELTNLASGIFFPHDRLEIPDDLSFLIEDRLNHDSLLGEILGLSNEIVTIREVKDSIQKILSTVIRITQAERGAIFLYDEKDQPKELCLRASKNITEKDVSCKTFADTMKIIKSVAKSGKGKIIENRAICDDNSDQKVPIRSQICVPMVLRDKIIGVLYNDNRLLGNAFKESDMELLSYFASQAAFTLDNASAYEKIFQLNKKLKGEKEYYEEQHLESLHFEGVIGESSVIKYVLNQVMQVAPVDTTVLITGETGVGKELLARAIHRNSLRSKGPFIRVHCNALPETLIPSELFGHEKGAFTGAIDRRIGRFELANKGTLFFDEIGDLPLEIQIRLLRVLQTKEFERVGGSETVSSDFRFVTATNRDLRKEVKLKNFREDLFYRINVFPIHLPPLRERKEDIPLLANYFLKIYSRKMGKNFKRISDDEIAKLHNYEWPGNIRELENIIERAIILNDGPNFIIPKLDSLDDESFDLRDSEITLKENERQHILWALKKSNWKVRGHRGAAELLDIHPSTLSFRMKKHGIQRPPKIQS
jgi:transcriptional regulator with GAF, ATPase, and Fis domain